MLHAFTIYLIQMFITTLQISNLVKNRVAAEPWRDEHFENPPCKGSNVFSSKLFRHFRVEVRHLTIKGNKN